MINFNIKTDGFWGFPHFKRHPCIHIYIYIHIYLHQIYIHHHFLIIYIYIQGKTISVTDHSWAEVWKPRQSIHSCTQPELKIRLWTFFCDLVEDLVNPNCQKDDIPKNDGKMTMICFPIKKPTWGQCDWNWFFIAISAQWLCDIIYIHIYLHTHIYIYLNTDYIHQDSRVNPI